MSGHPGTVSFIRLSGLMLVFFAGLTVLLRVAQLLVLGDPPLVELV
jgi:hypothetical protein